MKKNKIKKTIRTIHDGIDLLNGYDYKGRRVYCANFDNNGIKYWECWFTSKGMVIEENEF